MPSVAELKQRYQKNSPTAAAGTAATAASSSDGTSTGTTSQPSPTAAATTTTPTPPPPIPPRTSNLSATSTEKRTSNLGVTTPNSTTTDDSVIAAPPPAPVMPPRRPSALGVTPPMLPKPTPVSETKSVVNETVPPPPPPKTPVTTVEPEPMEPTKQPAPPPPSSKLPPLQTENTIPRQNTETSLKSLVVPPTPLAAKLNAMVPPTVEEQDFLVLWVLSFLVPFFMLRFVFKLTKALILTPTRLGVRFAPGGARILTWIWVTFGPVTSRTLAKLRARLPDGGGEKIRAALKVGLEVWIQSMQTGWERALPHIVELGQLIQNLKFREATMQAIEVLKAWAPTLLLIVPFVKTVADFCRQFTVAFWSYSKRFTSFILGSFLRRGVEGLGKSLAENSDDVAERVAGICGPIIGIQVAFVVFVVVGVWVGLIDYDTLSRFYVAWLFKLLGLVDEPIVMQTAINVMANNVAAGTSASTGGAGIGSIGNDGSGDDVKKVQF